MNTQSAARKTILCRLADNRADESLANWFRRRRFALFRSLLESLPRPITILDVGGTQAFWKAMGYLGRDSIELAVLNLSGEEGLAPGVHSLVGDARDLSRFRDKSVDVIFSNSVIEHLPRWEDQRRMSEEIRRVGKRYFVQTPNYYFPLEPHFLFFGYQFLPIAVRAALIRSFPLGWVARARDWTSALEVARSVRLLRRNEMQELFPEGIVAVERVLGMAKSFTAYGGWEVRADA